MIIQPTGSLPGDFEAVNSEEIQNISLETLPANATSRVGRFGIIFRLEGKPDVEWKYPSEGARDADYAAIIALINAGVTPPTLQDLQSVTDEGSTTTNSITAATFIAGTLVSGTVATASGIGGTSGGSPTWGIDNATGDTNLNNVVATTVANTNGIIKPYRSYVANLVQNGGTGDPIVTVQENTLSQGDITWTRDAQGVYHGTLVGAFPGAKFWKQASFGILQQGTEVSGDLARQNDDFVAINIYDTSYGIQVDGFQADIEIRIYN